MDSLIAIGTSAGFLYGIYAIIQIYNGNADYVNQLYFEAAGTILTLITLGKYLEAVTKGKTSEAIKKLMGLAPKTAIIIKDGKEIEIPIDEVETGDIILVKPGEKMPVDGIHTAVLPWIKDAIDVNRFNTLRIAELLQPRTELFSELAAKVEFLMEMPEFDTALYENKKMKTNADVARQMLAAVKPVLEGLEDWSEAAIHDAVMALIAERGVKNGLMLWPLRIAISGRESTPGGAFEIAYLLGKEETMRRLNRSIGQLG
jgi:hypothetical protein